MFAIVLSCASPLWPCSSMIRLSSCSSEIFEHFSAHSECLWFIKFQSRVMNDHYITHPTYVLTPSNCASCPSSRPKGEGENSWKYSFRTLNFDLSFFFVHLRSFFHHKFLWFQNEIIYCSLVNLALFFFLALSVR